MLVPELLLDSLEELLEDDFNKLKWFLSLGVLSGCPPVPRCYLENSNRMDTVSSMMKSYGEDMAVNVTVEVLKKMRSYNAAETLERRYEEAQTAARSGTRTSAVPLAPPAVPLAPPAVPRAPPAAPRAPPAAPLAPPAPATLLAQQGGVIFAPTITSSTSGTWNINIQK